MKLIFNSISKSYGNNKALDAFSDELGPGIHALLGPNGSGKSTLMNIITGNLKADEGSVIFSDRGNSEDIRKMGNRFSAVLGFMPQYPGLYPNFTVEQFMWYMATLKDVGAGMSGRRRREYVKDAITDILRHVELDSISRRKIGALSGGMKQRLALAQAVLGDPAVLILDEPTAGLDPKQRIAMRNYISQIAFNKIVIIATHVVTDIESIARDVIILKKGTVIANAPAAVLTERMRERVWNVRAPKEDIGRLEKKYRVTSIAGIAGISGIAGNAGDGTDDATVRVISDISPAADGYRAEPTAPTLEDYYLYIFNERGV